MDWMREAACADKPVEWWFPLPKKVPREYEEQTYSPEKARSICRGCPVQQDCLEYALNRNDSGVWGGYTQRERREIRKKRRRQRR